MDAITAKLRRLPKVAELRLERAPKCRTIRTPIDISRKAPVARHDVGVTQNAQYGRHHQVAGGKAVTVKKGLVTERLGQGCKSVTYEGLGTGAAKFGPFLIRVEQVDHRYVHHERLNGI